VEIKLCLEGAGRAGKSVPIAVYVEVTRVQNAPCRDASVITLRENQNLLFSLLAFYLLLFSFLLFLVYIYIVIHY
jgi:hypothetical protein